MSRRGLDQLRFVARARGLSQRLRQEPHPGWAFRAGDVREVKKGVKLERIRGRSGRISGLADRGREMNDPESAREEYDRSIAYVPFRLASSSHWAGFGGSRVPALGRGRSSGDPLASDSVTGVRVGREGYVR